MENIFNSEKMGDLGETLEKKFSGLSSKTLLCAGAGSLFLAGTLKLAGKGRASSLFAKGAIALLAVGCYKKYSDSSSSKTNENIEGEKENLADNDPIAST